MSDCERCTQLEALLKNAEHDIAELGAQLAGVQIQARRAGQAEVAIRRQLQEAMEADPKSEEIRDVLNHWQAHHPRAKCPTGGKRFVVVKKALKLGFDVDQLKVALDGLRQFPYVGPGGRKATGDKSERYDDVEHALRDEATIERFIGYATDNPPASARPKLEAVPSSRNQPSLEQGVAAINVVLERLSGVKPTGLNQWVARCPAHEDKHASMSVAQGREGVVVCCHAGCSTGVIADAIGVPLKQWFDAPTQKQDAPARKPDALPTASTLNQWAMRLANNPRLLARIREVRGWTPKALVELGVGWDGQRFVFPIVDETNTLVNIVRYVPNGQPKSLGLRHRPRGLFPAPEKAPTGVLWVVEGEPDAITLVSLGVPAIGVPGANGWRPEWATRFTGRTVVIVPDCDPPGRQVAARIHNDLQAVATVRLVDLGPDRTDGYDITDWIRDHGNPAVLIDAQEQAA